MYAAALLAIASVDPSIRTPRQRYITAGEVGQRARTASTRIGRSDAGRATIWLPFVSRMRNHPR